MEVIKDIRAVVAIRTAAVAIAIRRAVEIVTEVVAVIATLPVAATAMEAADPRTEVAIAIRREATPTVPEMAGAVDHRTVVVDHRMVVAVGRTVVVDHMVGLRTHIEDTHRE